MPSVLFVCTANINRSPLAAALFQKLLMEAGHSDGWQVASAGTWTEAGRSASPISLRAAQAEGVSLEAHRTQMVTASLVEKYDLILTMENGQKEALQVEFPALRQRVRLLSEVADGLPYDVADFIGRDDQVQADVNNLCRLVKRGFTKICQLAASNGERT